VELVHGLYKAGANGAVGVWFILTLEYGSY